MRIQDIIQEGVHDPGIFKAVFFIGGPGSGKSYVGQHLALSTMGLTNVDSDVLLTMLMHRAGLDMSMPPEEQAERDQVRARAKELTKKKQGTAVDGRLGLQVQGTGYDFAKLDKARQGLEDIGYETALVVVNVDLGTAQHRNHLRATTGPVDQRRGVDPKIVAEKWQQVQANIEQFRKAFPFNFVINNSPDNANLERDMDTAYRKLMVWTRKIPNNPTAQDWIQSNQK